MQQVNVAFNHNNERKIREEGKKIYREQLRRTPHWMKTQPPESLRNIWPTETKVRIIATPLTSHEQKQVTPHLRHPVLMNLPSYEHHVRRDHYSVNRNARYIFDLWEFIPWSMKKEGKYTSGTRSDGHSGTRGLSVRAFATSASAFLNAKLRGKRLIAFSRDHRFLS